MTASEKIPMLKTTFTHSLDLRIGHFPIQALFFYRLSPPNSHVTRLLYKVKEAVLQLWGTILYCECDLAKDVSMFGTGSQHNL